MSILSGKATPLLWGGSLSDSCTSTGAFLHSEYVLGYVLGRAERRAREACANSARKRASSTHEQVSEKCGVPRGTLGELLEEGKEVLTVSSGSGILACIGARRRTRSLASGAGCDNAQRCSRRWVRWNSRIQSGSWILGFSGVSRDVRSERLRGVDYFTGAVSRSTVATEAR
jgi:hypothetical protein